MFGGLSFKDFPIFRSILLYTDNKNMKKKLLSMGVPESIFFTAYATTEKALIRMWILKNRFSSIGSMNIKDAMESATAPKSHDSNTNIVMYEYVRLKIAYEQGLNEYINKLVSRHVVAKNSWILPVIRESKATISQGLFVTIDKSLFCYISGNVPMTLIADNILKTSHSTANTIINESKNYITKAFSAYEILRKS